MVVGFIYIPMKSKPIDTRYHVIVKDRLAAVFQDTSPLSKVIAIVKLKKWC